MKIIKNIRELSLFYKVVFGSVAAFWMALLAAFALDIYTIVTTL